MQEKGTASKPLVLLTQTFPMASGDELLEAWMQLMEEVAERAENYANAVEEGASVEVLSEAVRFTTRANELFPLLSQIRRVEAAQWALHECHKELLGRDAAAFAS